jgi:hypothetical protein
MRRICEFFGMVTKADTVTTFVDECNINEDCRGKKSLVVASRRQQMTILLDDEQRQVARIAIEEEIEIQAFLMASIIR